MKTTKLLLITIPFLFFNFKSEDKKLDKYAIITFKQSFNVKIDNEKSYLWMINIDSIKTNQKLSPLYISGYSNTMLKKCIKDSIVSPFVGFINDKYDFSDEYINTQNKLSQEISDNSQLILTIKKKHKNKLREKIKVYLVVVEGSFCNCKIDKKSTDRVSHDDIFLPIDNIKILNSFNIDSLDLYKLQEKISFDNISNK